MLSVTARKLFVLSKLRGIGARTLTKLAAMPDSDGLSSAELAMQDARARRAAEAGGLDRAEQDAERDLLAAREAGAIVLSILDGSYPRLLRLRADAPFFLYVLGSVASLGRQNAIAVIGTRTPTAHGCLTATRIARHFARQGWSVVSGLALGCDSVAHRAALECGGATVAVLAHGLQTVAPRENAPLARQIVEGAGALVTECAFGVPPIPAQFVRRDRIQAGLSRGVVMVQSGLTGGSLHGARAALEYGRVLAVPCPTPADLAANPAGIGANRLLCGGDDGVKANLLGCRPADLDRVVAIRSKDDYGPLATRLGQVVA